MRQRLPRSSPTSQRESLLKYLRELDDARRGFTQEPSPHRCREMRRRGTTQKMGRAINPLGDSRGRESCRPPGVGEIDNLHRQYFGENPDVVAGRPGHLRIGFTASASSGSQPWRITIFKSGMTSHRQSRPADRELRIAAGEKRGPCLDPAIVVGLADRSHHVVRVGLG